MVGAPQASGGYRDERDAALAQVESLRQQVATLEPEVQRLRVENDMLRRELARYSGKPFAPRRSAAPVIIVAFVVMAMMVLGGVVSFVAMRSESTPPSQPVPVSMPVEVTPPSVPTAWPRQMVPSGPMPSGSPSLPQTGT